MSNPNTFADVILHQNNGTPLTLTPATAGHFAFQLGAGNAVLSLPNPLAMIDAIVPFPGRAATALPFIVRVAGTFTLGGNAKYQIDLNQGTALAPAVASTGLLFSAAAGGTDNFLIECEMLWDPTSQNLRGIQYGWSGPNAITQAITIPVTVTSLAQLQFTVGVTVLNVNPVNSFTLSEFSAEVI